MQLHRPFLYLNCFGYSLYDYSYRSLQLSSDANLP